MKRISVDFDGVLIPNDYEKRLILEGLHSGYTKIAQFDNKLFDWYTEMVNTSPNAPLNTHLLKQLTNLKDHDYAIVLWTNRSIEVADKTIRNLAEWSGLFDSFEFYGGQKSHSRVEGIAIDNSPNNLRCAEHGGILYEWR
jgi:hypothetical protein